MVCSSRLPLRSTVRVLNDRFQDSSRPNSSFDFPLRLANRFRHIKGGLFLPIAKLGENKKTAQPDTFQLGCFPFQLSYRSSKSSKLVVNKIQNVDYQGISGQICADSDGAMKAYMIADASPHRSPKQFAATAPKPFTRNMPISTARNPMILVEVSFSLKSSGDRIITITGPQ